MQAYQKGDADERLGLFLAHRDLRGRFLAIDLQESRIARTAPAESRRPFWTAAGCRDLLRRCLSLHD